jgi:phenylacetate-CoA ligase
LARHQYDQLVPLAEYCAKHSRQFRRRLADAKLKPDDLGEAHGLAKLPVLRRRDLQVPASQLYCAEVPPDHLPLGETSTSGSTGEPVRVRRTNVVQWFWMAIGLRDHIWHRHDFGRRLATVRATVTEARNNDWGPPANLLYRTGPSLSIPSTANIKGILERLAEFRPDHLLVYPNILAEMVRYGEERGRAPPRIRYIRTTGETLSPELREAAAAHFEASVEDCYSSQELGYMALQCPDSGLYHVMAESVLVEVLDADGRPCRPGEIGRIVVTDLHNFATPLIRYDIADYAEVAEPCPCGRGLPTLKRIMGRERNLILMPDGSRQWSRTGYRRFRDIAPVQQFQFVQRDRENVEVRLVTERPLTPDEEAALRAHIQQAMGHPFAVAFVYFVGRLPPDASGKFEDFICLAKAEDR